MTPRRPSLLLVLLVGTAGGCDDGPRHTYPGGPGNGGGLGGGTTIYDARSGGDASESGQVVLTPCERDTLHNDSPCGPWSVGGTFGVSIADLTIDAFGRFTVPSSPSPRVLVADPDSPNTATTAIVVPPGDGVLDLPFVTTARLETTRAASALGQPGSATVVARAIAGGAPVAGVFGTEVEGAEPLYPTEDDDTFVPGVGSDAAGTIVWLGVPPGAPTISLFSDLGDAEALVPAVADGVTFVDVVLE